MKFLYDWISFIGALGPHLQLHLATRIADLEALKNPFELDGIPLLGGSGKPFDYNSFMASKSRVIDGPAGGVVVQISDKALFFLGIREKLLEIASNQSFEEIIHYKAKVGTIWKKLNAPLAQRDLVSFNYHPL